MRTFHKALEAVETYSPAEEQFNNRRRTVGLYLGPLLLISLIAAPLPIAAPAHKLAGVLAMMVAFWVTEALPLAVTAMLGPVLAVILRIVPVRAAFASFSDPVIFVFIGGFILAEAMFVHGVDQRIAYTALSQRFVGTSATRILLVFGGVTMLLSMWMSNTATTAMMYPIGLSMCAHLARGGAAGARQFALVVMLITSFGASIGGMGTPVGTPPNLIGIGMLQRLTGTSVSFFHWMALGVPVMIVMFAFVALQFYFAGTRHMIIDAGSTARIREQLAKLGPVTRGQRNVLIAFAITVVLWVTPGLFALVGVDDSPLARAYTQAMPESVAALVGATLLFLLPVDWKARRFTLTWDEALKIDWGIVLLYGGGLAMGELAFQTGLAEAIGRGVTSWLPSHSTASLTMIFTGTAIVLSEATSNTAAANMIIPIAIAVSQAAGVPPLEPALGATLGASMGFMMPVSTPPNAIVYSSGFVPITKMMRYGIMLDIVGFFVIVGMVLLLGPLVL
ncbi:MAG TPA: DASS family sodium-coupled anion symporter [Vicinamibacterales bacterium]|nr:DASS family sodium-coupled anion symporter [Vicinamibacterales bacterium]